MAAKAADAPTLNYGLFFNTVVNFVIVGFVVFLLVRTVNRMTAPTAPTARECPYCTAAISVHAV